MTDASDRSTRSAHRPAAGYLPSPEDIQRACQEIQRRWTPEERADRWVGLKRVRWAFPRIAMREVFGDRSDERED
jgi:hypothetical protein